MKTTPKYGVAVWNHRLLAQRPHPSSWKQRSSVSSREIRRFPAERSVGSGPSGSGRGSATGFSRRAVELNLCGSQGRWHSFEVPHHFVKIAKHHHLNSLQTSRSRLHQLKTKFQILREQVQQATFCSIISNSEKSRQMSMVLKFVAIVWNTSL